MSNQNSNITNESLPLYTKYTWLAGSQYNNEKNSYLNASINLKTMIEGITSYVSSYILVTNTEYINSYISYSVNKEKDISIIPVDYNNIYSYITTYSTNLISYYIDNLNQNLTNVIKDELTQRTKTTSYFRNNSKKISELISRDTITKHKDHSWLPVAQYDSRINSYHNIAINLDVITSYSTNYTDDRISYTFQTITSDYNDLKEFQTYTRNGYVQSSYIGNNIISYSFAYSKSYIDWQHINQDEEDLVIGHKLISINSQDLSNEALLNIQQLVDNEESILFDSFTHRIYTLGKYYGGDTLKENLYYFTKLFNINVDNEVIEEISASTPESNLNLKATGAITINLSQEDGKSIITFGTDLNKVINSHIIKRKDGTEYKFFINKDGQIDIEEYSLPEIELEMDPLEFDECEDEIEVVIPIKVNSIIDIKDWTQFDIESSECDILNINGLNMTVKFYKGIDSQIIIKYNDTVYPGEKIFDIKWNDFIYYGLFDGDLTWEEKGKFALGDIEQTFTLDQGQWDYGFIMIPDIYKILIIDDLCNIQGAWHKRNQQIRNNHPYNVFVTDNEGLGIVRWKIIKNII